MKFTSIRRCFVITSLATLLLMAGCSQSVPNCGSNKPITELPNALKELGIPFDETSKVCNSLNPALKEFNVGLSHASGGNSFELFEIYKTKFTQKGFKLATSKETKELIREAQPKASKITEYFYKDDLMIMCKIEPDIVYSGLQEVTLRDLSSKLIATNFDLDRAKKELSERFTMLAAKTENVDSSKLPEMKKEMLGGKAILFQIRGSFAENVDKYKKDEIYQLSKKHSEAKVIALIKDTKVANKESDPEKDGNREEFDAETGRTTTYFKGGTKSGTVYFMDIKTGKILGKRSISARNSSQTSDEGKDLLNNYYREIEKLETEFGALDRSMK